MPWAAPVYRPPGYRKLGQKRAEHYRKRRNDPAYKARKAIYDSKAWQTLRTEIIATRIWCERCLPQGVMTYGTEVHHKTDLADGGDAWDLDNLELLCKPCHSRHTLQEMRRK